MSDGQVPTAVRRLVEARAAGRCEYCRAPQSCGQGFYGVEHVRPRSVGGGNDPENLAWSCQGCNGMKGIATTAIDPMDGEANPLFHPRQDRWDEHFAWDESTTRVVGLTAVGRATVLRLRLNREGLLNMRRLLHHAGEHP